METSAEFVGHLANVRAALTDWTEVMAKRVPWLAASIREARIVWLIGNGGSQACAEHWATDWHKVTQHRTPTVYVAPAANAGLLTMLANDFGYDQAYAHALAGVDPQKDLVIALSTSGRSPNLLQSEVHVAVCPEKTPLASVAGLTIAGPPYAPAVLEDVFSILGHAVAEELRA